MAPRAAAMRRLALLVAWLVARCAALEAVELVAVVLTVPAHRPHRDAIRGGWGRPSTFDVAVWFVVSSRDAGFGGEPFVAERAAFGNLVVCDAPAGFDRIIHKVSCAARAAVARFAFDYLLKTDDDATLCLGQVIKDLRAAGPGPLYAGRKLKARRPLADGKPLRANLGLTHDPPHFGGHGYAVTRDVAALLAAPDPPRFHHLHEDTNFGLWMVGLAVKRVNLRAMTDHYYPNAKNVQSVRDPAQVAACEALMANRYRANASWDLHARRRPSLSGARERRRRKKKICAKPLL